MVEILERLGRVVHLNVGVDLDWSGLRQLGGSHIGARVRAAACQATLQEPIGVLAHFAPEERVEYRLAPIASARNVCEQGGA